MRQMNRFSIDTIDLTSSTPLCTIEMATNDPHGPLDKTVWDHMNSFKVCNGYKNQSILKWTKKSFKIVFFWIV